MQTHIRHALSVAIAASLMSIGAASAADAGASAGARAQGGMQGSGSMQSSGSMQTGSQALMSLSAEELDDMDVKNQAGDEIGEVEGLVRSKETNELYLVIETGGIFDIGDEEVVIKLSEAQLQGDDLVLTGISSQEALESREKFDASRYQTIDDDDERTLAELSGGAAGAGAAMAGQVSFDDLDEDDSGYLTEGETKSRRDMQGRWADIDKNEDDRIDRSEFSAFEAEEGESRLERHMERSGHDPDKKTSGAKQEGSSSRY